VKLLSHIISRISAHETQLAYSKFSLRLGEPAAATHPTSPDLIYADLVLLK